MDYRQYYDLESYLLDTVQPRFMQQKYLSTADFFCIVIWKANRAKSKIAKRLLAEGYKRGYKDLDATVQALTSDLAQQASAKDRLRYLCKDWGFGLPMASAILAMLYPDDFTVYDVRVCETLGGFYNLGNRVNFENLWRDYQEFKRTVEESTPGDLKTLREKDRYLWGKSFYEDLMSDIEEEFNQKNKSV